MDQEKEVRYELLRPAEVVAARTACPVVYIPLGADTLQAHGLAQLCARRDA